MVGMHLFGLEGNSMTASTTSAFCTDVRDRALCEILNEELVCALGCTEPIAVAYAAALARMTLGTEPEALEVGCSGNIIKNVKSVNRAQLRRHARHRGRGDPGGRGRQPR